ncbi:phage BR0599 family protein [Polymorphobacter multimanifer]|nr:phage BR0599 family protein [Polymorphobacter multimanifer]
MWLWEGCDRRFATCSGRFGNGRLFRGEPHVPGNDMLMQVAGL